MQIKKTAVLLTYLILFYFNPNSGDLKSQIKEQLIVSKSLHFTQFVKHQS